MIIQLLRKIRKDKNAFTLVEMLVVLLIVGILMAIIIPNISGQRNRVEDRARENIAEILETQISTYQLINGEESVSLTVLYNEDYITERQLNEAQKLLELDPNSTLSVPINVP